MTTRNMCILRVLIYFSIIFTTIANSRTFHLEGHVNWVDFLDRRSSNFFELQVGECEWRLKTTYRIPQDSTNVSNRSLNYSFDGTNTYFHTSAAWTTIGDPKDVNTLEIYPGNLPDYKHHPDTVTVLWLAFCGGCYTSTNQEIPALLPYPIKGRNTERKWKVTHASILQNYTSLHHELQLSARATNDGASIGDELLSVVAQRNHRPSEIPDILNYSYSVFTPALKYRTLNSATIHVQRVSFSKQLPKTTPEIRGITFVKHDGRFALSPTNQLTYLTSNGIPHPEDRVLSTASARIRTQEAGAPESAARNNWVRRLFFLFFITISLALALILFRR